jgi:hypothetical protein
MCPCTLLKEGSEHLGRTWTCHWQLGRCIMELCHEPQVAARVIVMSWAVSDLDGLCQGQAGMR